MTSGFGAFGKMPGLGDFFRTDLPRAFVEPWDEWLQKTIVTLRSNLGDGWQTAYMSAPIWRFTLSPGLVGQNAMLGVLMASVDRVGRQFPLTLCTPVPNSRMALLDHYAATETFQSLETIAFGALEDDMTRERLSEQLNALPAISAALPGHINLTAGTAIATHANQGPSADLAAAMLHRKFRAPSVWSADLEDGLRVMTCEGLPNTGQAAGLLDLNAPIWQTEVAA